MFVRTSAIAVFATLVVCAPAFADPTANKAWVSGVGTDSSTCGAITAPCRSLQYALTSIVTAGGSIYIKDSGTFGALAINKSISVINEGAGLAVVNAPSGVGITVQSGATVVVLQGLLIDGFGTGTTGIVVTAAAQLSITNATIKGFTGAGLSVTPGYGGNIVVSESVITSNGSGIYTLGDSSGSLTMNLSHDQIVNNGFSTNGYGIRATGGSVAYQFDTIEDCHIADNGIGLSVEANGSNEISVSMYGVSLVGNNKSMNVANGVVHLEKSSIEAAYPSAITNSGSVISYGDNVISDSVTGNAIATTPLK